MNRTIKTLAALMLVLPLAACGGDGDDALADRAEDNYEAAADRLDGLADNATTEAGEDALEANASALRERGEDQADAIDDSDVDADDLTEEQRNAMTTVR